jgi:HPt (histidine-containing phosphotransfer) domain-containing protein
MDDYLAKPIRANQLIHMVLSWVTGKNPGAKEPSKEKESFDIPVVDQGIVDSLSEAVGGDPGFVKGMLVDFIAEAEQQIAQSEIAYRANDCQGVQSELHTLKGNSGTLGAAAVHALCEAIELKAKVCNFEKFETEIIELKNALNLFKTYVDTL